MGKEKTMILACPRTLPRQRLTLLHSAGLSLVLGLCLFLTVPSNAQPPGVIPSGGSASAGRPAGPPPGAGASVPQPILRLGVDTALPSDATRHAAELRAELKSKRGWQNVIKPGVTLRHERYEFDAAGLGLDATELPDEATHAELGISLLRFTPSGWSFFGRGELSFAAEDSGELGDDVTPFVLAAAGRQFANRNKLGFGLIAKQDIEENWRVFPIPTFELHFANDWSLLSERGLLLQRALAAGADGRGKPSATFGIGVDYLNSRFRAASGEVWEYNAAPAFLEWQQTVSEDLTLKARIGAVIWGEIERDSARGRGIEEADVDSGLHAAIQATWNF